MDSATEDRREAECVAVRQREGGKGRFLAEFQKLPRGGPDFADLAGRRGATKCCCVGKVMEKEQRLEGVEMGYLRRKRVWG